VIDWTVHEDGDVTLEFDHDLISDELIEDALAGMGFKLISELPVLTANVGQEPSIQFLNRLDK
jgi:hypothetical protein